MYWNNIEYSKTEGYIPQPRAAHTCDKIGNFLYVFGGWNGEYALNTIDIYDIIKSEWNNLETSGDIPTARNNHSSCSIDNFLYIHGGHDGNNWLDNMYYLNLTTFCWKKINSTYYPSFRACHTLSLIGGSIYLFGGYDGKKSFNDIEIFDIKEEFWRKEENVKGTIPSTRNAHTASVIDNKIFIFGGHYMNEHLNDMYSYEVQEKTWTKIVLKNNIPRGLRGHTSTFFYDSLYIFGGFDGKKRLNDLFIIDMQSFVCTCVNINNLSNDKNVVHNVIPRQRHSAVLVNNSIMYFGGFEGTTWLENIDVLDLIKFQEVLLQNKIKSQLKTDYKKMLNDVEFSDVSFILTNNSDSNNSTNNSINNINNSQIVNTSSLKKELIAHKCKFIF